VKGEVFAEFGAPEDAMAAADRLRELGYTRLQAYTPYPIPELEEKLRVGRSKLPVGVFAAGITGTVLAFVVIWFCNAADYPLDVGGRPLNSFPADVPIMFETTVLFAGIAAFGLALVLNRLPRLYDALSEVDGMERASVDRYVLRVAASDPRFDSRLFDVLEESGVCVVRTVGLQP
jgi:hypothetical protein